MYFKYVFKIYYLKKFNKKNYKLVFKWVENFYFYFHNIFKVFVTFLKTIQILKLLLIKSSKFEFLSLLRKCKKNICC